MTLCKKMQGIIDFRPQANWHWLFDHNRSTLTLNMGDRAIDIVYKPEMLILKFDQPVFFTIEDVANYIDLFEGPALAGYWPALRSQIILHILVVNHFHKPIMPKNWLFESSSVAQQPLVNKGDHIILKSSAIKEAKKYFVLDNDDNFILCMLIEKSHGLTFNRTFAQFQIVKVTYEKISATKADCNTLCQYL
ncbi:hypothetical protein CXF72_16895 [Psychromonas sp. MB-3u-54]|nr:hypothetical protein CXF72_16895 [Psychromonas sp. MB-3u-54]